VISCFESSIEFEIIFTESASYNGPIKIKIKLAQELPV